MIEEILPAGVAVVDTVHDADSVPLFPEEECAVARAVDKRRREFTTGRACARSALAKLGVPAGPIPSGERGEPCWPPGVVGSITHCVGYRACAVAHGSEFLALGIDAEPHAPLPDGLLGDIALPEEAVWLDRLQENVPGVHWDRLLFSAKESVYKAWFPLARRWLGFEDALLNIDAGTETGAPGSRAGAGGHAGAPGGDGHAARSAAPGGTFNARLLVDGPTLGGSRLEGFDGRWAVRDGLVLTAVALEAHPRPRRGQTTDRR